MLRFSLGFIHGESSFKRLQGTFQGKTGKCGFTNLNQFIVYWCAYVTVFLIPFPSTSVCNST